jgi:hypothetical protein
MEEILSFLCQKPEQLHFTLFAVSKLPEMVESIYYEVKFGAEAENR